MSLEHMKTSVQIKKLEAAKAELELKAEMRKQEIKDIEAHIELQKKNITELEQRLKELEG